MLEFSNKYGKNIKYSQFGEEGIIEEVLRRIELMTCGYTHQPVAVEFGGHDGYFCSNTRLLEERTTNWRVRMYDINPQSPLVEKREITPENVNNLPACQILSIDCDGPDYGIWQAYKGQPDIVIIEINSSISPYTYTPVNDKNYGTGYLPMLVLGLQKGYFLLCHTANCVFVLNKYRELFPECVGDGIGNCELYFNTDHLPK